MQNWLEQRKQRDLVNGMESWWTDIPSGVPQGSVLGPVLFVIYANDLGVSEGASLQLFADAAKLSFVIDDSKAFKSRQCDIDDLHVWALENGMLFNTKKCLVQRFGISEIWLSGEPLAQIETHWCRNL